MKKKGTVKVYKRFPKNSLSYKLQKKSKAMSGVIIGYTAIGMTPLIGAASVAMGQTCGLEWYFVGAALHAAMLAYGLPKMIKNIKELDKIKQEIIKSLIELEPNVIETDDDVKTLKKTI